MIVTVGVKVDVGLTVEVKVRVRVGGGVLVKKAGVVFTCGVLVET